jgi:SAM-dependent methyltransferase
MRDFNLNRLSDLSIDFSNTNFLVYYNFHNALKKAIISYSRGSLLDIGCGNKPYESLFQGIIDKYTGCDIVQSSLNKADLICPANNIPIKDNSFDTVISTQTIEHVDDHQGLVSEAYRLLKPDGYFILSGPMYWPLHEEPYDYFRFTQHGLKFILEKAGFEVIEINSNGGKWALAGQALIHAFENSYAKSILNRIIISLYNRLNGRRLLNRLFLNLDREIYCESSTINYVVVCKK